MFAYLIKLCKDQNQSVRKENVISKTINRVTQVEYEQKC